MANLFSTIAGDISVDSVISDLNLFRKYVRACRSTTNCSVLTYSVTQLVGYTVIIMVDFLQNARPPLVHLMIEECRGEKWPTSTQDL